MEPKIKGTLFSSVVDDLQRLLVEGRVDRESLEVRRAAELVPLLDAKVDAASWYDLRAYEAMVECLKDFEGEGNADYYHERGVRAARRLIEANIYQQLEFLGRRNHVGIEDANERRQAFERDIKLIMTIQSSLVNFGKWSIVRDPDDADRFRMEVHELPAVGDTLFRCAEGFFTELWNDEEGSWLFSRPRSDLVYFRMSKAF